MDIQELLDLEANLGNTRLDVHKLIKEERAKLSPPPPCWGQDDCSTYMLMRCPWRIDCETGGQDEGKDQDGIE